MVFFIVIQILLENSGSKHFAASDMGLHCLSTSYKKDAMPLWVN